MPWRRRPTRSADVDQATVVREAGATISASKAGVPLVRTMVGSSRWADGS